MPYLSVSRQVVEDTTLQTAGTALMSAGIAILTTATIPQQTIAGCVLVVVGFGCFWLKYSKVEASALKTEYKRK